MLFLIFGLLLISTAVNAQIIATDADGCLLNGDSWFPAGTVAGHNTYQTLLTCCGVPARVQWNTTTNRWEIIAAVDGDGLFNDLLYYNNNDTAPNPPALSVGGWTDSGFGCGPLTQFSGPYTTAASAPVITSNPVNRAICSGNNTTFSIAATGATSYQWQVNSGSGFTNVTNGGVYSGATTTTLTITGATAIMNGYQFRAVATGSGSTNSNAGTLTVSSMSVSTAQANVSCFGGANGAAAVAANGGVPPYSYSWSPAGGTSATAIGLSAGNYTVTITDNIGC